MNDKQVEKLIDLLEYLNGRLDAVVDSIGGVNFGDGDKKVKAFKDALEYKPEEWE